MDADYYGYRDEDDGIVVPLEQEEEKRGTDHVAMTSLVPRLRGLNLVPKLSAFDKSCVEAWERG